MLSRRAVRAFRAPRTSGWGRDRIFARIGARAFELETTRRRAECSVFQGRFVELVELTTGEDAGTTARILGERTWGYALHHARRPKEARPHLETSLALAGESGSEYESALSLRALALTKNREEAGLEVADAALELRGVVSIPKIPLP